MNKESKGLERFEKKQRLMSLNKKLSNFWIYTLAYVVFGLLFLGLVNIFIAYMEALPDGKFLLRNAFVLTEDRWVYGAFAFLLLFGYVKFYVKIRQAYSSLNVGQKGSDRPATRKEIDQQYKKIPYRGYRFPGKGGIPIARGDKVLYIDDSPVNNLIIGITRSGKGEMEVFPLIDIYSRAEEQASMVITDPKLELAQSSIPRLTDLGYECHILNLVDPEYSMGYNPLTLMIEEYKNGDIPAAEQLAKALCYSIYSASQQSDDPFWSDNSTSLLTALILASIEDNLKADKEENAIRLKEHELKEKERKVEYIKKLSDEDRKKYLLQEAFKEMNIALSDIDDNNYEDTIKSLSIKFEESVDFVRNAINSEPIELDYVPEPFVYTNENEKKINLYSIITTFITLANEKVDQTTTELDKYFFDRPENNKARIIYGSIGLSGDKTKGSIYSSMLTGLNVFTQTNIAKMTAKSTIDINKVGFGGKPIAIFIGIPDYDPSNHFLASVFIKQLYYTLAKLATASATGKCRREVIFILDEFGNLPAIEGMSNIATVCLGRNIRFNLIIQSYSQVAKLYGADDSKTIIGNCGNHIYILTADDDTAEAFAKRLGHETITDVSRSGGKYSLNKSYTESNVEAYLLSPTALTKLKPGEMIVSRTMKRNDLKGRPVRPWPIFNLGDNCMLYRYQYLLDYFPSGQQLYQSPIIERVNKLIEEEKEELKNRVACGEYFEGEVSLKQRIKIFFSHIKEEVSQKIKSIIPKRKKEEEEKYVASTQYVIENTKGIVLSERMWSADSYLANKKKYKQPASSFLDSNSLKQVSELLYLTSDEQRDLFSGGITLQDLENSAKTAIQKGYKKNGYMLLQLLKNNVSDSVIEGEDVMLEEEIISPIELMSAYKEEQANNTQMQPQEQERPRKNEGGNVLQMIKKQEPKVQNPKKKKSSTITPPRKKKKPGNF